MSRIIANFIERPFARSAVRLPAVVAEETVHTAANTAGRETTKKATTYAASSQSMLPTPGKIFAGTVGTGIAIGTATGLPSLFDSVGQGVQKAETDVSNLAQQLEHDLVDGAGGMVNGISHGIGGLLPNVGKGLEAAIFVCLLAGSVYVMYELYSAR